MYTSDAEGEDDVWVRRLDRWTRLVVKAAVLGLVVLCLATFALVYYDMLQGVWRLKASKLKLEQGYCRTEHVSPAEYQDICVPARKTLDQSGYVMALDLTGEYFVSKMPFVAYCRAHSDMCTLWGTKLVDVFDSVARWLPMVLPMLLPMLFGLAWKAVTRAWCRRKEKPNTNTTSNNGVVVRQIEGLKTE